jgi:feruloyl esterase
VKSDNAQAGAVNYPHMGGAVSNYGFATASTNTGHESSGTIGTWAANNTETQIDFGYRAVHLSTIFSKNILEAFYGIPARTYRSYWIGCSAGGKQGLKEIQSYPEDYDGALVGCPAWHWSHLMAWSIMGSILNPLGPGYMSVDDWSQLRSSVISQCDALDGVTDGIVSNPTLCHIDWQKTGLSSAQQEQAKGFYRKPNDSWEELVFPEFSFGSEEGGLSGANDKYVNHFTYV